MEIRNFKLIRKNFLKNCQIVGLTVIITATSMGCTTSAGKVALAVPSPTATVGTVPTNTTVSTIAPNLTEINNELRNYGKFLARGMKESDYQKAMSMAWTKVIPTAGKPENLSIDLTKRYTYKDLENFILNLAKYDGVEVNILGKTPQKRNIYSISINMKSKTIEEQLAALNMSNTEGLKYIIKKAIIQGKTTNDYIFQKYGADSVDKLNATQLLEVAKVIEQVEQSNKNKPALLYTGQVHANEFAGSVYILKQFSELVKDAQTNEYTRLLLENVRFEAIPLVNPDGREITLVNGVANKKSNANGVDLNRNFPSVNSLQLPKGVARPANFTTEPSRAYYSGPTLGSEIETQAAMSWFNKMIPMATYYIDYHQQGRGLYYVKLWDEKGAQEQNYLYGKNITEFLNNGVKSNARGYIRLFDATNFTHDGNGGTITDYAMSAARVPVFNPKYGVLTLGGMPILKFDKIDNYPEYYKPVNPNFHSITLEITRNDGNGSPIGYSQTARNLINQEYYRYHYDKLLPHMAEYSLGNYKTNALREQAEEIRRLNQSQISQVENNNSELGVALTELLKAKEGINNPSSADDTTIADIDMEKELIKKA